MELEYFELRIANFELKALICGLRISKPGTRPKDKFKMCLLLYALCSMLFAYWILTPDL